MRDPALVARPIRRVTVRDQVAAELQRLVVSGAVPVGEPLPSEAELCRMFGCSRGAVREALRGLEQAGLVVRAANGRELIVQSVSLDKLSDTVRLYMQLEEVTFEELFEFLEGVEPWTARRAALRCSDAMLIRLQTLNDVPLDSVEAIIAIEEEFHDLLAEATGNRMLLAARLPLSDALNAAMTEILPLIGEAAITGIRRAHDEIIAAIVAKDEQRALDWSLRHAQAYRRALQMANKPLTDPVRPLQSLHEA